MSFIELYIPKSIGFDMSSWLLSKVRIKDEIERILKCQLKLESTLHVAYADKLYQELLCLSLNDPMVVIDTAFYQDKKHMVHIKTIYPGEYTEFEAIDI